MSSLPSALSEQPPVPTKVQVSSASVASQASKPMEVNSSSADRAA